MGNCWALSEKLHCEAFACLCFPHFFAASFICPFICNTNLLLCTTAAWPTLYPGRLNALVQFLSYLVLLCHGSFFNVESVCVRFVLCWWWRLVLSRDSTQTHQVYHESLTLLFIVLADHSLESCFCQLLPHNNTPNMFASKNHWWKALAVCKQECPCFVQTKVDLVSPCSVVSENWGFSSQVCAWVVVLSSSQLCFFLHGERSFVNKIG